VRQLHLEGGGAAGVGASGADGLPTVARGDLKHEAGARGTGLGDAADQVLPVPQAAGQ
jgi:hypothetical protein